MTIEFGLSDTGGNTQYAPLSLFRHITNTIRSCNPCKTSHPLTKQRDFSLATS
jgi:hypothetical protein